MLLPCLSYLFKQSPFWIQITLCVLGSVPFLTLLCNGNYLLDCHTRKISCIFEQGHRAKTAQSQDWKIVLLLQIDFSLTLLSFAPGYFSGTRHLVLSVYCSQLCFLYVTSLLQIYLKIILYVPNTTVFCYLLGCSVYCFVLCFCSVSIFLEAACWSMVKRGGQNCQVQCFPFNLSGQNSLLNISLYLWGSVCIRKIQAEWWWRHEFYLVTSKSWPGMYLTTGTKGTALSLLVMPVCSDLYTSSYFLLFSKSMLKTGKWMI